MSTPRFGSRRSATRPAGTYFTPSIRPKEMLPRGKGPCEDEENHPITIRIVGVFQDEHVLAKGSGRFAPDAVIKGQRVDLRTERSGPGVGRMYHVKFRARDSKGAVSRVYTLYATVSRAPGKETPPKNGKALYPSTVKK